MRRVVGWIAAVVVLAGTAVGVLALVETSMASAAPSGACLRAEEQVQAQEAYLWLLSAVERTDVFLRPLRPALHPRRDRSGHARACA